MFWNFEWKTYDELVKRKEKVEEELIRTNNALKVIEIERKKIADELFYLRREEERTNVKQDYTNVDRKIREFKWEEDKLTPKLHNLYEENLALKEELEKRKEKEEFMPDWLAEEF